MSGGPLAERISNELAQRIATGRYAPGQRLPSEAQLCAELDVSRPTLRDAMSRLAAIGLIHRHQGRGTYVAEARQPGISMLLEANLSITAMIESMGLRPGTTDVRTAYEVPNVDTVQALQLGERDAVLSVSRVRTADGVPVVLSHDYLPASIPGLPADPVAYGASLYHLLGECCGEPIGGALARIEPALAAPPVAQRLGVGEGALLLVLHQTHHLVSGRRVLYSTDYLRGDVFTVYVRRTVDSAAPAVAPPEQLGARR